MEQVESKNLRQKKPRDTEDGLTQRLICWIVTGWGYLRQCTWQVEGTDSEYGRCSWKCQCLNLAKALSKTPAPSAPPIHAKSTQTHTLFNSGNLNVVLLQRGNPTNHRKSAQVYNYVHNVLKMHYHNSSCFAKDCLNCTKSLTMSC